MLGLHKIKDYFADFFDSENNTVTGKLIKIPQPVQSVHHSEFFLPVNFSLLVIRRKIVLFQLCRQSFVKVRIDTAH